MTEISLHGFFGTGNLREMFDSCEAKRICAWPPTTTGISRPVNAPAIAYVRTLLQALDLTKIPAKRPTMQRMIKHQG